MSSKWTLEQIEAIETRNCNLLVAAAAGSGKTAVLVERIIKMITDKENPVDIDRLLVVTFTNAAASEMRERIGDAISDELEKDPSSQVLQRQLSLLNRSNIMTMHSFCLDVIKNNYHNIDLDPSFRIGDETECYIIREEIINDLLEDKYEEGSQDFLDLVETYGGKKNDDKLKEKILLIHRFVMSGPWPKQWLIDKSNEFNIESASDLDELPWSLELRNSLKVDIENSIHMLREGINICERNLWLEKYLDNLNEDYNLINKLYEVVENGTLEEVYEAFSFLSFSRLKTIKKADIEDEDLKDKVKKIRDTVKEDMSDIKKDIFSDDLITTVKGIKSMYPIIRELSYLTIEFMERYNNKKREKNILDFNDLEHLCLQILIDISDDGKVMPSKVAREFKEKFVEVLVDEYQDSSNIQETIINMVSRKNDENPNVFMVGDIKQSIYRFRQAKPSLFSEKYESYTRNKDDKNRKVTLYKNFRSRKEILDSANFIFKTLMSKTVGELEYNEDEQLNLGAPYAEVVPENITTREEVENPFYSQVVDINIVERNYEEVDLEEENKNDDSNEDDLDTAELEAIVIGNKIKELMNPQDGRSFVVWDKSLGKYRNVRYKDIVILLRATKGWSDSITEVLGNMGIPIYADTGTGYFQTIEIRTVMSLLHIIDNPRQDIYIIAAMKSPIFSFNAEELAEIRLLDKDKYFYENIEAVYKGEFSVQDELKEKIIYFYEKLELWRTKVEYMPMDEFIWFLYSDTSYYGYVGAMANGVQRQANLRILFQRAKQYESTSFKGLFNFINFINKLKRSTGDIGTAKILGENEDVVRIMSIHKSKGLEFPVVFLSATGKRFNFMDMNSDLLYHDDLGFGADIVDLQKRISYSSLSKYAIKKKVKLETLSEEMRVLYVALTRPREKLIITGSIKDINKYFDKWSEAASMSNGYKITEGKVIKAESYLDWIGMALSKHIDGNKIRENFKGEVDLNIADESKWIINTWKREELASNIVKEEFVDKELNIENIKGENFSNIKERLNYEYRYKEVSTMPSNISVSELKRRGIMEEEIDLFKENIMDFDAETAVSAISTGNITKKKPKFIEKREGLTAAEKGTLTHFVMQHIDYSKTEINDIKELINDMVKRELLMKDEAEAVNIYRIRAFFKSNIGERLLKAYNDGIRIYRELPFFREIPVYEFDSNLDKNIYSEDKVRLQGIIDCFFEDKNGIVLIDYKTDYVEEGKELEILERYKVQIDLYSKALENILGKKVDEKYLYLFGINKEVKY
ncbi:helicase-exonuclease AddAB subunit AddA [Clostridium massiliamazoniense]|uniref:helicase-exonuclease AddAB subunit AddA n=1 Tax=Clostridium massiliamazoniense TaxID=1347366 RepID=UPI0006D784EB|nr:helicase-exonuclease AddAB subunit AddA [Clostridium massiliamazoniense]